jgi:hypothetical protein
VGDRGDGLAETRPRMAPGVPRRLMGWAALSPSHQQRDGSGDESHWQRGARGPPCEAAGTTRKAADGELEAVAEPGSGRAPSVPGVLDRAVPDAELPRQAGRGRGAGYRGRNTHDAVPVLRGRHTHDAHCPYGRGLRKHGPSGRGTGRRVVTHCQPIGPSRSRWAARGPRTRRQRARPRCSVLPPFREGNRAAQSARIYLHAGCASSTSRNPVLCLLPAVQPNAETSRAGPKLRRVG